MRLTSLPVPWYKGRGRGGGVVVQVHIACKRVGALSGSAVYDGELHTRPKDRGGEEHVQDLI